MKSSRLLLAITVLAFLFTLAVSTATAGSAGGYSDRSGGAPSPAQPAVDHRILVQSFDVTTGAIVVENMSDKTLHTYKINAATRISVGRSKGTIDQIKAGQSVFIRGNGGQPPETVFAITVFEAAPMPVPPANK
jgi:hypothetical protein